MKTCSRCKKSKPLTDFYSKASRCKGCISEVNKERRQTDAAYRRKRIDKGVEWNRNNPLKVMLRNAKTRAQNKGIEFSITEDDLRLPEYCPILGIKLEWNLGAVKANSPSLDRMDSSKGYTCDNVWIISSKANRMKSDASSDELRAFADWVRNVHGTTENPTFRCGGY